MDANVWIIVLGIFGVIGGVFTFVLSLVNFYFFVTMKNDLNKIAKLVADKLLDIEKTSDSKLKEMKAFVENDSVGQSEALSAILALLIKEFKANGESHQDMFDSLVKAFEVSGDDNKTNLSVLLEQIVYVRRNVEAIASTFGANRISLDGIADNVDIRGSRKKTL